MILVRRLFLFIIFFVLFFSCNNYKTTELNVQTSFRDLGGIIERGKLVAITDYNSISYFLYKGEPMGFNFELLGAFASYLGVDLEIRTENDIDKAVSLLNCGEADIVAMNLTVNCEKKDKVRFTTAISETRQVLVQRKPNKWRSLTNDRLNSLLLRNHLDLAGKVIYAQKGSYHPQRVRHLQSEIGDSIGVIEIPYGAEDLLSFVANGDIDYAVVDENYALVASAYYPDIDVSTPLSFTQKQAWAMRRNSSGELAGFFDRWLEDYRKTKSFALLFAKYYRNPRSVIIQGSRYYANTTGRVSPWDELIRQYSDSISWDWRLLAALIYQESRFDPFVTSRAGAYGLMQVMPSTGKYFGIDVTSSPENNLRAGISYIRWLDKIFRDRIPDDVERLKFILASYNAGPGHVLDAMRLASSEGIDSSVWYGAVESFILKKSEPRYYNHPEVQHGYFKGRETVAFVSDIMKRYDHYLNLLR